MAIKYKGKAVLNPGTKDETWGLCDDLEIAHEADKEQIKNGDGDTVGLQYTDLRQKVSGNYTPLVAATETDPPCKDDLIGEELTITLHGTGKSIKIIVDDASIKYKRGGVSTFAISGYYYPKLDAAGGA